MATACIRVQAPEKLADNVAPVGFTPLHDMGRGNYAISGSGVALPAPAAGRLIVVTTAALVQPFSSVSAIELTKKTWATAKSGVVIEVSVDGCQWRPIEPKYAMVPSLQAARKISDIVGSGGWEKSTTSQNAAHVAVLLVPQAGEAERPGKIQGNEMEQNAHIQYCCDTSVGSSVTVHGVPYGVFEPHVFFDTMTAGIVCNKLDSKAVSMSDNICNGPSNDTVLAIVDAPCHPGTAGGRVVLGEGSFKGYLFGMVLPPLQRKDGLVMELSLVLPWHTILQTLQLLFGELGTPIVMSKRNTPQHMSPRGHHCTLSVIDAASSATVLIHSSSTWGTGALVSAQHGIVLTNAHIFRGKAHEKFRVRFVEDIAGEVRGGEASAWYNVHRLYVSTTFVDIAVLRIELDGRKSIPITRQLHPAREPLVSAGQVDVMALGYPSFPPLLTARPTITFGKATAQAARDPSGASGPVGLLLTTASVHPGSSGGPIVRLSDGKLVGVLTSFSQCCDEKGTIITAHPTLNFAVPTTLLSPLWDFIRHGAANISTLRKLDDVGRPDSLVSHFWPSTESSKNSQTTISSKL